MYTKKPNSEPPLVEDVMLLPDSLPLSTNRAILKESLEEMGRSKLGIVCIVDENHKLLGILTDGDIRRSLLRVQKPLSALFVDDTLSHATCSPVVIGPKQTLSDAVDLMEKSQIWDLPVVTEEGTLAGLLHLHRAIKVLMERLL